MNHDSAVCTVGRGTGLGSSLLVMSPSASAVVRGVCAKGVQKSRPRPAKKPIDRAALVLTAHKVLARLDS